MKLRLSTLAHPCGLTSQANSPHRWQRRDRQIFGLSTDGIGDRRGQGGGTLRRDQRRLAGAHPVFALCVGDCAAKPDLQSH